MNKPNQWWIETREIVKEKNLYRPHGPRVYESKLNDTVHVIAFSEYENLRRQRNLLREVIDELGKELEKRK